MNAKSGVSWRRCTAALALFLVATVLRPATAQDTGDPVELGRDAFGKRSYPWYDSSKDAPKPLRVGKDTETRSNQKAAKKTSTPTAGPRVGISIFGSAIQALGLIALTVVLVAAAALIVWAFLKNETNQSPGASVVSASRDVDRVEELPFAVKRTSGDFLSEARRLAESGNYSEAIIYLYSHMLVQLDRHHVIRLAKGKTNRQYLRETRLRPNLADILETTMIAFEDVFFGQHALPAERFEECHGRIGEFQAELDRLERQAA